MGWKWPKPESSRKRGEGSRVNPEVLLSLPVNRSALLAEFLELGRWRASARLLSFPKIQSGGIGAVRQNQRIIRCDVCDHPPACNLHSRSVQAATPA
jgi:hypothetical protein